MKRRSSGGVFREIDEMLLRFEEQKGWLAVAVKERLGKRRAVRIDDTFWAVRWKGVTYRALSPEALLEKLPKRAGG